MGYIYIAAINGFDFNSATTTWRVPVLTFAMVDHWKLDGSHE